MNESLFLSIFPFVRIDSRSFQSETKRTYNTYTILYSPTTFPLYVHEAVLYVWQPILRYARLAVYLELYLVNTLN